MKFNHLAYQQFMVWVQKDMKRDWSMVNRKVFSVVFWCLILPALISVVLFGLRKFQVVEQVRYADTIVFLPPFVFALYSLWPTLRDIPGVFRKGGMGNVLEESSREVDWREKTASRLTSELKITIKEWDAISFHLEQDLERMKYQNRYLTLLSAVVLFFLFQFLDLGGGAVDPNPIANGPVMARAWVEQFSQWSIQVFSLILFATLFYLSGLQFQRYLTRYAICVKLILRELNSEP